MASRSRDGSVRRATIASVVAVVALAVLSAGCSAEDRQVSDAASGDEVGATAADDAAASGGEAGSAVAATASQAARSQPTSSERIAYDADLRVRVDDPSASAEQALGMVEGAGGVLADQFEDGGDQVRLTVRIPVDRFHGLLDDIADLGVELGREVSAEEVTDRIVDLDARLRNARASADRLRELFADAADVNQVVAVESALTDREAEVESLTAQLAALEDRADRSTLTVTFVDEGEPPADDEDDDASAFVRGLRAGWDAVQGFGSGVAAVAGFALPLLPLLAVVVVAGIVVRRRRRSRSLPA